MVLYEKADWKAIEDSEENLKTALYNCDTEAFQEAKVKYIESLAQSIPKDLKEHFVERLTIYEKVAQEITSEDGVEGVQDRIKGYSEKLELHRRCLKFIDEEYIGIGDIATELDKLGYTSQRDILKKQLDELKAIKDNVTQGYESILK